ILYPVNTIGTVIDTAHTFHTLVTVDADLVLKWNTTETHSTTLPITGSPALGIYIVSTSGSIVRIAASSLEI
ncbi:MAG: hypothetical protein PWQ44_2080, partial [Methanolobus sp.]|nr:hypothetical protein [Methanolobus sp.]